MHDLLVSRKLRLAFILPTLTALGVAVPLVWFLLHGFVQEGAATQLLRTLPVVSGLVREQLSQEASILQAKVADLAEDNQVRITLIDERGTVLADSARSWQQVAAMDNHAERPEIVDARARGRGSSVRRSATTGVDYVYAAGTVADTAGRLFVVRLAQPLTGLAALRRDLALVLLAATAAALATISGWLWWLQRQISRASPELVRAAEHLKRGDFSYRIPASPRTELGRLGGFLNEIAASAQRQITELQTEREQLFAVVSSMREGVLVTDAEGFVRLANDGFRKLFGITNEVEGRTPLELTRLSTLEDLIVQTLTGGDPRVAELEIESPASRHLAIATSSLGEGSGAVIVLRDITDLVAASRIRRDLVANISHELKTPLTAIRGYAETLRYGAMDDAEASERFLDRILQQCTRLQALLEDLLTLSRLESLESLEYKGERSPVQLEEVLDDSLDSIRPQVAERDIRVRVEAEDLPPIEGDRDALERLMINLLDNAVKYNRFGGSVQARLSEHNGEVIFEVSDTGIGIPSTSLSRVFERFYRVDKGRSREEGGTGLGLAIVKHVAQLHGGRVDVESDLGKGSTFRVHLPARSSRGARRAGSPTA